MRLLSAGMGLALVVEVAILRQWAAPLLLWPCCYRSSLGNIAYSQLAAAFAVSLPDGSIRP